MSSSTPKSVPPSVTPTKGIELLQKRKANAEELLKKESLSHDDYERWKAMVEDTLTKIFGYPSDKFRTFYGPKDRRSMNAYQAATTPNAEQVFRTRRLDTIKEQIQVLDTFIELLEEHGEEPSREIPKAAIEMDLFISHSKKDEAIATALINLFRSALHIEPERIRCTSVPGYKLPTGASTEEQLRREVHGATVLIGLITPNSLRSAFVLFELGARWGAGLHLWPVLADGSDTNSLRGPLKGINALTCYAREDLQQLLEDLGNKLGRKLVSPNVYAKHLEDVIAVSKSSVSNIVPAMPRTAVLSLNPRELILKIEEVPPLQRTEVTRSYPGLWVTWTLLYSSAIDLKREPERFRLCFFFGQPRPPFIYCDISLAEHPSLRVLPSESSVQVSGQIREIDGDCIFLVNVTFDLSTPAK